MTLVKLQVYCSNRNKATEKFIAPKALPILMEYFLKIKRN